MIMGMGIFIGCRYGFHMGIDAATLVWWLNIIPNQGIIIDHQ
jgi:hypothetical protein